MNIIPKVSVIVPVYNAEQYLEECIASIANQTYKNIEVILIDDGSKDQSGNICDRYADTDERIKVIHQENQGLVNTWIRGTRESLGAYLCYVDSDDWIEKDMIETLLDYSTDNPAEMICSNISCDFPDRSVEEKNQLAVGVYEGERLDEIKREKLLGNDPRTILPSRCTKLIARKLIEDNIVFSDPSIKMGEDLNITLPALLDCKRLVVVDEVFYHYRQYGSSMAHVYNPNLHAEIKQLIDVIENLLIKKEIPNAKHLAAKEYIILLILVVKNELRGNANSVNDLHDMFTEKAMHELVYCEKIIVKDKAKKLIYYCMKHPNKMNLVFLKKMMQLKGAF